MDPPEGEKQKLPEYRTQGQASTVPGTRMVWGTMLIFFASRPYRENRTVPVCIAKRV
jgi:hypothetical protein